MQYPVKEWLVYSKLGIYVERSICNSFKEWPEDFEEDLRTTALPTADLAADLTTQVRFVPVFLLPFLSVSFFVSLSVCLCPTSGTCQKIVPDLSTTREDNKSSKNI